MTRPCMLPLEPAAPVASLWAAAAEALALDAAARRRVAIAYLRPGDPRLLLAYARHARVRALLALRRLARSLGGWTGYLDAETAWGVERAGALWYALTLLTGARRRHYGVERQEGIVADIRRGGMVVPLRHETVEEMRAP